MVPRSPASFGLSPDSRIRRLSDSSALFGYRALSIVFRIGRIKVRTDIMRLHIEDKVGRALLLGKGCRFEQLDLSNVKELSEDRVHGQQRSRHPTGRL